MRHHGVIAPLGPILVGTDFSLQARHAALRAAERLTHRTDQPVLVVRQAPDQPYRRVLAAVDGSPASHAAQALARRQLHARVHEAGLPPSQWEPCVVQGDVWTCIAEQAQLRRCDLVVLGRHGRRTVADRLLGSVTRRALAEGPVDVLVSSGLPGGSAAPGERR